MRYHVMAGSQDGVLGLKRDTLEGALKKAGELRREGVYNEVRIIDTATGQVVEEPPPVQS
jgi:hypothetical protein